MGETTLEEHFAGSRLAFITFIMIVHHPTAGEVIFIVLTRVLEHSSAFFLSIAEYCLDQMDMSRISKLTPIQDGPKQMKSLLVLGIK